MISTLMERKTVKLAILTRLDPRSKILFTFLYIFSVLMLKPDHISLFLLFVIILAVMIFFSGFPALYFIHKILRIYPMIFLITFLLPFNSDGIKQDVLFTVENISIYKSGLIRFIDFNLKYILIILSTLILTGSTPFNQLVKGLEFIKLPNWFLSVLFFMFRLIYHLAEEMEKMHIAYQSRYISLPYYIKIKTLAKMVGVYFIRIIERSERTYFTMISRGFSGQFPSISKLNWQLNDTILVSIGFIFTITTIMWY